MIKIFFLSLFFINSSYSFHKRNVDDDFDFIFFKRTIASNNIIPVCDLLINGNGIFTISYKSEVYKHEFYITKGLDKETCQDFEKRILNLKRKYKSLTLFGYRGTYSNLPNEIFWTWEAVTAGKSCISYFSHNCPNPEIIE